MSKFFIGIYAVIGLMFSMGVCAENSKLGYVDAVKLVETAPQGKQALKKLEDEFGEREQALVVIRNNAVEIEQDLQKNALVMSEGDQASKTKELRELERSLQRQQRELREDYNLRRNEELAKLQKIVTLAVIDIAKEQGYDLIVQQAVWFSPETDMTEQVLQRLSQMFEK